MQLKLVSDHGVAVINRDMDMRIIGSKYLLRSAILVALAATTVAAQSANPSAAATGRRPNIVIILGDDLGFSDLGSFGGEMKTPHLDSLANAGVRFTQFYTHASCSPTRSMLLSGVDTHRNGLGNMDEWTAPNQVGKPGYEGYLNDRVATLPQLLKDAGYHTYMAGKWHMGKAPNQIPAARGFERDFALLDGAGSYWDMLNFTATTPVSTFTEDGRYLKKLPKNYYATKTYTDKIIDYIEANRGDGKPFFAYVSHQAPHDPYHLPRDWRNRHVGAYDKGWDAVRQERLQRQVKLGITPPDTELSERMWFVPDPNLLAPAPRALLGKKMELYAGMVENMDFHVGRLIDYLKKIGEYDNTIFIVFRRQRRGRDRSLQDDCGHARHARLPVCRDPVVTNPSERLGRPAFLRRLRSDVGAGFDDPLQPVQGQHGRGRHSQRADRQRPDRPAASREHPPRRAARGGHHADTARSGRRQLSQDHQRSGVAAADRQVVGQTAGGRRGVAALSPGLPGVGNVRQPRGPAGRLEVALAIQTLRQGGVGIVQPGGRCGGTP